jgi:hypothetical protein
MASFDLYLGQLFERVEEPLTTPFEDWCREHAIHPEAWGAWERFELDQARTAAKAG